MSKNNDTSFISKHYVGKIQYIKINVILKFFQMEMKKYFSHCFSFLHSKELKQNELVPTSIINVSISTVHQYMRQWLILIQWKHTHSLSEENILSSAFVSDYLMDSPSTFSLCTLIRKCIFCTRDKQNVMSNFLYNALKITYEVLLDLIKTYTCINKAEKLSS